MSSNLNFFVIILATQLSNVLTKQAINGKLAQDLNYLSIHFGRIGTKNFQRPLRIKLFLLKFSAGMVDEQTFNDRYSYHVSIEQYSEKSDYYFYICSGAIILNYHVLTTASCVANFNSTVLYVRAGSAEYGRNGLVYRVKKIFYLKNFTATRKNVAVLKLVSHLKERFTRLNIFPSNSYLEDINSTAVLTAIWKN